MNPSLTPGVPFPLRAPVLKNLFSKPATVGYPFEPAHYPERMRGHVEIRIEDCISCGLCARNCPPGALKVDRAAGTWTINRFDCVQCGNCTNVCPKKCLSIVPGYTTPATKKASETFTRPKAPDAPAAGTAGGKTGKRQRQVRLLHPLRQKVPPGRHHGGPCGKELEAGCRSVRGLRNLRRLLPEKVPDAEVRKVPSSQHKTGRPGEKVSRTGRFF